MVEIQGYFSYSMVKMQNCAVLHIILEFKVPQTTVIPGSNGNPEN
ncbi:MAG: hypothetical protein WCT20_02715 [Candidatus Babeliales bacterium]